MSPSKVALLIDVIAGMLEGLGRVAVGASSPIPAAAAWLARERGGGRPQVSVLGSGAHSDMTDGGRELFDRAGQGRIDAFFLGGVQIDGSANINLIGTGPHPAADKRFPGSYGSAYLYFVVPRVILFRSSTRRGRWWRRWISSARRARARPRSTGPAVPTRWSPGAASSASMRRAGASASPRCTPATASTRCARPPASTSIATDAPPVTPAPSAETMALIRGPVGARRSEVYPRFAARFLGNHRAA